MWLLYLPIKCTFSLKQFLLPQTNRLCLNNSKSNNVSDDIVCSKLFNLNNCEHFKSSDFTHKLSL